MVDQFEIDKCLHAASTDNLILMIIDIYVGPTPGQTPGSSDGTNPGTWVERRCNTVCEGCWGNVGTWN